MPLTKKGKKIMRSMKEQYGPDKGEGVFYASRNKGTIKGVEKMNRGGMTRQVSPGGLERAAAARASARRGAGLPSAASTGMAKMPTFKKGGRAFRGDGCCKKGKTRCKHY
jgi:hypothetical protein